MNCISVMSVQRPGGRGASDRISVPCGKCPACLANKRASWAFRLSEELKVAETASFITLTYNEENNNGSLSKSQIQGFLKRLRHFCLKVDPDYYQHVDNPKLRYFLTGEYGSQTLRPHYHLLLFNHPLVPEMELYELIGKSWTFGASYIGKVTEASIMYVAKYLLKGSVTPEDCEAPFSLMSRRPGIGHTYVERMADWHIADQRFFSIKEGGQKVGLPRYYKDKIFSKEDKEENSINQQIRIDQEENEELERLFKSGDNPFLAQMRKKEQLQSRIDKIKAKGKL